jgi:hypothetical protein
MTMDRDYQTKDPEYDSVNKKLLAIVLGALAVVVLWYLFWSI